MIFINNTQTKRYYEIIEMARVFPLPSDTYTEKHHIIPRCFYKAGWVPGNPNDPDNLVVLTGREHFICHQLLTQMLYIGPDYYKMSHAFFNMCFIRPNQTGRYIPTPEEYESARILHSVAMSKAQKGRKYTDEVKTNMSKPRSAEAKANMSKAQSNRSAETRANMSKPKSDEHKANLSKASKGKPKSAESIRKRTETRKAKREIR